MKKILLVVVCLLLLTTMTIPVSAEGSLHAAISTGSSSIYPGELVVFEITVSGVGTCNAFGCFLEYDSSLLEYVEGSAYVDGAMISNMDSDGLVAAYESPSTPSGTVASFTMRVKDGASRGDTYISLDTFAQGAEISGEGISIAIACNHSYSNWQKYDDSYHQKTCGICGAAKEEEHGWNRGAVVNAPTCKNTGSMIYTCITCGETKEETLDTTDDHPYADFRMVDNRRHQGTCSACGETLIASHTWDVGKVTKQESCKETGTILYTCTDCGHTREETVPVSTEHSYSAWCKVDENKHTRNCSVCAKVETKKHNWNDGFVAKKSNCIEKGSCIYTCLDCNTTKTEELPVSDVHTYDHDCDKDCNVCGKERTTFHSFEDGWYKNGKEHWRECVNCGEKADVAAHIPGEEATDETHQYCTVCNYVLKPALLHTHTYAETYSKDKNGHGFVCADCGMWKDFVTHGFANACDDSCDVCGFVRKVNHDISEQWYADEKGHFQKCKNCGKEEAHIDHVAGAVATEMTAQTCVVCGYVLVPAQGHKFENHWDGDPQSHYHSCVCGEKTDVADHTWDAGIKTNGGMIYTCRICGFERFETRNATPVIIGAGAVAIVAAIGAVAAMVFKRRRK